VHFRSTQVNRISGSSVNGNYDRLTDKYLEDGSYLRVKNISVTYTLPHNLLGNQNVVRNVRLGVSVQNAFTITGYSGYDPEIGSYVGPNGNVDRKSTRLNSSHVKISYAVFCLKKKKKNITNA